jgi:hypothetical protein
VGQAVLADLGRHFVDRGLRLRQVGVVERLLHPGEGRVMPLGREATAEGPQGVDGAGQPREAPERDGAHAVVVGHQLVVEQGAALLQQRGEHGHVVGLPLDRVGEEEVGLSRPEELGRDLLHAEHDVGRGHVVDETRAGRLELAVGEAAPLRALDHDLRTGGDEPLDVSGNERRAPLPRALVLATDSDHAQRGSPSGNVPSSAAGRWGRA